jgi:hypothetical protein
MGNEAAAGPPAVRGWTGRSGSALAVVSALEQAACGSLQGVRGCEGEERGSKDRFSR